VRAYDAGRWLLLATLWSLQYIFLRVAVPVFGAGATAQGRAMFAALFLIPWVIYVMRRNIGLSAHWRDHLPIALANNVVPFALMAWAAGVLPAGHMSVINGLVPLWSAVFAAPLLGERLGARRLAGFALGIAGVALVANLGPVEMNARTGLATAVAVTGAAIWGWAGVLIKQRFGRVEPMPLATGSLVYAAVIMLPFWVQAPAPAAWTAEAIGSLLAVGIFVSGVAYLPFFTLIRDIGPSRTLTVGLTVPVLGVFWGWLILDETVTAPMLAGAALVVVAIWLVLRS
jgi:drug/metabolite transporter (DMT)-like permease